MSSVTAVEYAVEESAEVRRRQEQRAAWERFSAVNSELAVLQAEARSYRSVYGDLVAAVPAAPKARANSSRAKLERATAEAESVLETHRIRLRESVARAVRQQATQLLAAEAPEQVVDDRPAFRPAARPSTQDTTVEVEDDGPRRQARADRAAKLLTDLPAEISGQVRQSCRKAAEELMATPSESRAQLLLADLERRVRKEVRAAERVSAARAELEILNARVDALLMDPVADHAAATAIQREIGQLIESRASEVPAGLAGKVEAVAEQADRAYRRKVMAAALRMSFADLGHEVSEGFETVLADQGVAYVNLPSAEGYGVKILLDRDRDAVRTQVVRAASVATKEEDTNAQQTFCDNYPTLLARLRKHGVEPTELGVRLPGEVAVATVAENVLPAAQHQAQRAQLRERNL